jgi:hypothetical protein
VGCGASVGIIGRDSCSRCVQRQQHSAAKSVCPDGGRPGLLREATRWCGTCSRPKPPKQPPRVCSGCCQRRRHAALGLCSPCFQRDPGRPLIPAENLLAKLPAAPDWLLNFAAHLAAGSTLPGPQSS